MRKRANLSLTYSQLEQLLGLESGTLRSVEVSIQQEMVGFIHEDEQRGAVDVVDTATPPFHRIT